VKGFSTVTPNDSGNFLWVWAKSPSSIFSGIFCHAKSVSRLLSGMPDFSGHNIPKRGKMYQMAIEYT
jgi:hypothetical protein